MIKKQGMDTDDDILIQELKRQHEHYPPLYNRNITRPTTHKFLTRGVGDSEHTGCSGWIGVPGGGAPGFDGAIVRGGHQ